MNVQIVLMVELSSGHQESRTNHLGDITYRVKLARTHIKALYGNQNFVKCLVVSQLQSTSAMAYFVLQTVGCVLIIGLKRILDTVRKDSYASIAGMKLDRVGTEQLRFFDITTVFGF